LINNRKKILVICYANYCRSPVAEVLLKRYVGDSVDVHSAGINPMYSSDMDIRSRNFLESINVNANAFSPKKITSSDVNNADIILAMDTKILMFLNSNYANNLRKIKIFNFLSPKLIVNDPYRFNKSDYITELEKIDSICKLISKNRIEDLL